MTALKTFCSFNWLDMVEVAMRKPISDIMPAICLPKALAKLGKVLDNLRVPDRIDQARAHLSIDVSKGSVKAW